MDEGTPPSAVPKTPQKNNDAKDSTPAETQNRNYRVMFEDMRSRFNKLKKSSEEQTTAHEKILAERNETIMELKAQVEKPPAMKMSNTSNEDAFVPKLRKGATGPTNGCDLNDVDLIRCSLCDTLVCEGCSGVTIAKPRPII